MSPEEEIRRAAPVVSGLIERGLSIPISVDTFSATVAEALVDVGASLVNDVSGGSRDPMMLPTVARLGVPAVLMHMRGTPQTMQSQAVYSDVVAETRRELMESVARAQSAGVPRWDLIGDPGIGFAKTAEHNVELLRELRRFGRRGEGLGEFSQFISCPPPERRLRRGGEKTLGGGAGRL